MGESALANRSEGTGAHAAAPPINNTKSKPARSANPGLAADSGRKIARNKFIREDTGTHETLTIIDDSLPEPDEDAGIDPYNTGAFDRSKNWNNRFRN